MVLLKISYCFSIVFQMANISNSVLGVGFGLGMGFDLDSGFIFALVATETITPDFVHMRNTSFVARITLII